MVGQIWVRANWYGLSSNARSDSIDLIDMSCVVGCNLKEACDSV